MLEPELEAGLFVLALIHTGKISISCINCDEKQKKFYHCDDVSDQPIFEEGDWEFYTCPLRFLNKHIYDFYDEASYYDNFPGTAPAFGSHNERFFAAYRYYKAMYNKYAYDTNKPKDQQTDQSLKELRKSFNKRRN